MTRFRARLSLFLVTLFTHGFAFSLTAIEMSPAPTYRYTQDANDLAQLTDGKIVAFPIWTKIETVGWDHVSPATLKFTTTDTDRATKKAIRVHTAVGEYASVKPITHIDAYTSSDPTNNYVHVGQYHMVNFTKTKESYYIDFGVSKLDKYLVLIIHTSSGFIFTDEVSLTAGDIIAPTSPVITAVTTNSGTTNSTTTTTPSTSSGGATSPTPLTTAQLIDDSRQRVKDAFATDALAASGGAIAGAQAGQTLVINTVDCYAADFSAPKPLAAIDVYRIPTLYLNGQLCLQLGNNTDARKTVSIEAAGWKAYEIKQVIMRDGTSHYDALVNIDLTSIAIDPRQSRYVWLDVADGNKATANPQPVTVVSDSTRTQLPINFKGKSCTAPTPNMSMTVWSYSSNQPIWKNRQATLNKLLQSHVNIFTIHPSFQPVMVNGQPWSAAQKTRLLNEINFYGAAADKIMLVTGWARGRDFNLGADNALDATSRAKLQLWINEYTKFIKDNNIPQTKLVLYPVDEPQGDKLDDLFAFARAIHQMNPALQLYANPTNAIERNVTRANLDELSQYITIWQPNWGYVVGKGGTDFFQSLKRDWWIYDTPFSPSRAADPGNFFRRIAWRAWSAGATGIGTWSFDATNGTSAWDDFDGNEADWALVYESDDGFTPSRRWFAINRGVEDIWLMNQTTKSDTTLKTRVLGDQFTLADMNKKFSEFVGQCGQY